jgi:hypothetical protein
MVQAETSKDRRWHVGDWPALPWLETAFKGLAILIGIYALSNALSIGQFALPTGARLAQFIVLGILDQKRCFLKQEDVKIYP